MKNTFHSFKFWLFVYPPFYSLCSFLSVYLGVINQARQGENAIRFPLLWQPSLQKKKKIENIGWLLYQITPALTILKSAIRSWMSAKSSVRMTQNRWLIPTRMRSAAKKKTLMIQKNLTSAVKYFHFKDIFNNPN